MHHRHVQRRLRQPTAPSSGSTPSHRYPMRRDSSRRTPPPRWRPRPPPRRRWRRRRRIPPTGCSRNAPAPARSTTLSPNTPTIAPTRPTHVQIASATRPVIDAHTTAWTTKSSSGRDPSVANRARWPASTRSHNWRTVSPKTSTSTPGARSEIISAAANAHAARASTAINPRTPIGGRYRARPLGAPTS